MNPETAPLYLQAGASHAIVTSYLFEDGRLAMDKLKAMSRAVGRDRLVVDLSCRRTGDGGYYAATDRWQTVTKLRLSRASIADVEEQCDELLIHAADVEGLCRGIDEDLVALLADWVSRPTTYAGGARSLADIRLVEELSGGKVDLTIGSALDIFGGTLVRYQDAARLGRR
jgi:phosphoribosylformimino-5-aminoimidazole carboxamide ribotide isomerase